MRKKIRDIIDREVILNTRVNYTQEFGVAGRDSNIVDAGRYSIFRTKFNINSISFVTVNGVTQSEGRDYRVQGTSEIVFIGNILKNRTVTVGYFFAKGAIIRTMCIPPRLNNFSIDPSSGAGGVVKFTFDITPNDARNIFWSIHKDGESSPIINHLGDLLSGTSLHVDDGLDGVRQIQYNISNEEYAERQGQKIPFTLIVVYDLTTDAAVDEKIVSTATYEVGTSTNAVANINITPSGTILQAVENKVFNITYSITKGMYDIDFWEVIDGSGKVLASGDNDNIPTREFVKVTRSFKQGDKGETFTIRAQQDGIMITSTAKINVRIAAAPVAGKTGYIDEKLYWASETNPQPLSTVEQYIKRGIPDYVKKVVPGALLNGQSPIQAVTSGALTPGQGVRDIYEFPKEMDIRIYSTLGGDITESTYTKIDGGSRGTWIYVNKGSAQKAPPAPVKIKNV